MKIFFRRDETENVNLILYPEDAKEMPYCYDGIDFKREAISYKEVTSNYKELEFFKGSKWGLKEIKSNSSDDTLVVFEKGTILLIHYTIMGYGEVEQVVKVFKVPHAFSSKIDRENYERVWNNFS